MSGPEPNLDRAVHRLPPQHVQHSQQYTQQHTQHAAVTSSSTASATTATAATAAIADLGPPRPLAASSPSRHARHVTLDVTLEVDMLRHKLRLLEAAVERHGLSCPALPSACTPLHRCFDVCVSASMPSAQPAYCSPAQASRHASLLSPRPKRPGPCSTGASASKPPFLSKVSWHLQARGFANSKCLDLREN